MKLSIFTLLFVALTSGFLTAQPEFKANTYYDQSSYFSFEEGIAVGETAYVFGDVVNVRKGPNSKKEVAGQVIVGQKVAIIEVLEKETIQNMTRPWYKIEYTKEKGKKLDGYVWGGTLALGATSAGEDLLLLGEIPTKQINPNPEDGSINIAELRAVRKGKILHTVSDTFSLGFGGASICALDSTGLEGISGGMLFITGGGACGVSSYSWYVLWNGEKLQTLPILSSVGDAGVFYESYEYFFPNQQPDYMEKTNKIYVKYEIFQSGGENEEEQYDELESTEKTLVRALKWDGKKYVLPQM